MLPSITVGVTLAFALLAHLRKQANVGRSDQVIEIIELVVLALDVDRADVDRPIIGLK